MAVLRDLAPAVFQWILYVEDLSGVDGQWRNQDEPLSSGARELLELAGKLYLPWLAANARAFRENAPLAKIDALGEHYEQAPFGYQVKCWKWLLDELRGITGESRARLQAVLEETGCWEWFRPHVDG